MAVSLANAARLKKPKPPGGHARYGNPEREKAAIPIVNYPAQAADLPDWMTDFYAAERDQRPDSQ